MPPLYTMIRTATALGALLGAASVYAQTMEAAPASPGATVDASTANTASTTAAASARIPLRGIPTGRPVSKETLTPEAFTALLQAKSPALLQIAGTPKCTVNISSLGYHTIGGAGEPTTAATAVMEPSGSAAGCSGTHPVVLYGHGTSTDKNYDSTNLNGDIDGEDDALLVAAVYAAQGFTVVMPNYAGYAGSTLPYAPFLNADQQSADMIDALRAARIGFPSVLLDSIFDKLFVTGYSQGAHVALATLRAMQQLPIEFRPAAFAAGSGPYALSHLVDEEIDGAPSASAPLLFDLIVASWQHAYNNVYRVPTDTFAPQYAARAPTLLPGTAPETTLFAENAIPATALFQTGSLPPPDLSNPDTALVVQSGFAPANFFLNTSFREQLVADVAANPCSDATGQRIANCAPATGLRQDALRNDLLDFKPAVSVQVCGAHSDSVVYFSNTQIATKFFQQEGVDASKLTMIDVDPGNAAPSGPFAALQAGFAAARAQEAAQLGNTPAAQLQLSADIHTLAAPFCVVAARSFFQSFK
ncbi:alpha/beta hydrolase [Paraburkholderia sp. SARCC-3016]|uniref:alpha/beta hydrolase family protein n=1 Tax=Paraburkholderia sp. SARCC-3016 TaxID=3058611 RepID=UPI002806CB52|nr:alpha/beta hydrolase [Paraburkholderia sp. SARCC-3016]MDQ7976167.1 alpha/beta hydrolase [Paraburkholderia sp. SARCC-3016]